MPTLTVATPADDRSLVTLARVKSELGIPDTASDALLTGWIASASSRICEACGVAPDQRGRRTFLAEQCVVTFSASEVRPGALILPWRIPAEVVSITVDGAALGVSEFEADPMTGLLYRLDASGHRADWPHAKIVVTLNAGWDADELPTAIVDAALALVRLRWLSKDRDPNIRSRDVPDVEQMTYFDPDKMPTRDGLPEEIAALLAPYRNVVLA